VEQNLRVHEALAYSTPLPPGCNWETLQQVRIKTTAALTVFNKYRPQWRLLEKAVSGAGHSKLRRDRGRVKASSVEILPPPKKND